MPVGSAQQVAGPYLAKQVSVELFETNDYARSLINSCPQMPPLVSHLITTVNNWGNL